MIKDKARLGRDSNCRVPQRKTPVCTFDVWSEWGILGEQRKRNIALSPLSPIHSSNQITRGQLLNHIQLHPWILLPKGKSVDFELEWGKMLSPKLLTRCWKFLVAAAQAPLMSTEWPLWCLCVAKYPLTIHPWKRNPSACADLKKCHEAKSETSQYFFTQTWREPQRDCS